MNTRPIVPAHLGYSDDGTPFSAQYQDIYHPRAGAFVQARHVFLAGNGLPQRWQSRSRFVVLETGFGLGNNFLATWQAWRDDPARCARLTFISVEQSPLSHGDMQRAHSRSPAPALASQLVDAWPLLTHNLHTIDFEGGQVRLLLAFGDAQAWLPELVTEVDAFYLDGFAPARNPLMWEPRVFKALARLATPGASLATWTAASDVHQGLQAAGFNVHLAPGTSGKRDITVARYAPRFTPRHAPSRPRIDTLSGHALIVGAGLAGCAAANALAAEGWTSTVYDRQPSPAQETSGNPAGLFHGIVNPQDGLHARFNRAAALLAQHTIGGAIAQAGVAGATDGLLRLDSGEAHALRDAIAPLGLPAAYVRVVDADEASALSGLPLRQAAWFYPGGGWAHPGGLARAWLAQAGPAATFRGGIEVARLRPTGQGWQLLDADGVVIDEAQAVVLTNAADAMRLLGAPGWPVETVRGQVSYFERSQAEALLLPRIPVAGAGYVLPEAAGLAVFGATAQPGDPDPDVREADTRANLAQLSNLVGATPALPTDAVQGRVGWRTTARDRLPLIGAVPDLQQLQGRLDHPRFVPRLPGLYVFSALASRGMVWAPLGARVLASWMTGSAAPLEAGLLDAIDPARFVSRQARRPASPAAPRTPEGD